MPDNDKPQAEEAKKPETAEERLEQYKKDPESFIKKSDLILAIKKSPNEKGFMIYISSQVSGDQIMLSQAKLNRYIDKVLTSMEMQAMKKKGSPILNPFTPAGKKAGGAFGGRRS